MSNSGPPAKALAENWDFTANSHRGQAEALRGAETRTLEMIADGAKLSDVLNDLCVAIDEQASATSFVCLVDESHNQLLPECEAKGISVVHCSP